MAIYYVVGTVVVKARVQIEADSPEEAYKFAGAGQWNDIEITGFPADFIEDDWNPEIEGQLKTVYQDPLEEAASADPVWEEWKKNHDDSLQP